jgi:DNA-binding YbaB/EbfC family protein
MGDFPANHGIISPEAALDPEAADYPGFKPRGEAMSLDESPFNPAFMKQAKLMQDKMAQAQENARKRTVTAASGGGMVTVTANGGGQVVSIQIDPQVVDPQDLEMLTDLIISAVNQALAQAQGMVAEEVAHICVDFDIPKMFG